MLIAISGKLRSGKDTIASMICNKYTFDRYALADELRVFIKKIFKAKTIFEYQEILQYITDVIKSLPGDEYKINEAIRWCFDAAMSNRKNFIYKENDKNRDILQFYGELVRKYEPSFWIQALFKKIDLSHNNIITDVRLLNEYMSLRNYGFSLVRVIASDDIRRKLLGENRTTQINHSTETNLDNIETWDYIIYNNGDLADLEIKTLDMVRYFEEKNAENFSLS